MYVKVLIFLKINSPGAKSYISLKEALLLNPIHRKDYKFLESSHILILEMVGPQRVPKANSWSIFYTGPEFRGYFFSLCKDLLRKMPSH